MQKRKDRRFKQWNKTFMRVLGSEGNYRPPVELNVFTYDLSLTGARLHSEEPLEVGQLVQLTIELVRTKETVKIEGEVKWIGRNDAEKVYEMGIAFLHSSPQTIMGLMKSLHDQSA